MPASRPLSCFVLPGIRVSGLTCSTCSIHSLAASRMCAGRVGRAFAASRCRITWYVGTENLPSDVFVGRLGRLQVVCKRLITDEQRRDFPVFQAGHYLLMVPGSSDLHTRLGKVGE